MNYYVLDVGGTFVKYAVMNSEGDFITKGSFPSITSDREAFLNSVETRFHDCEEQYGPLSGIAISMAGILDVDTGYVFNGGAVYCLSGMNIIDYFTERCGVPVTIENDAKAAAQAELWRGNLSDSKDGVIIVIGTAIGGAVIIDRKVLRGRDFFAGEFSYIIRKEPLGPCHENTWGKDGGVRGLIQLVADKKGVLTDEMDGYKVFELVNAGDEEAVEAFREYCAGIATRIWNFHAVLNPGRVLIGGGISAQPILVETVREELYRIKSLLPSELKVPEIMPCKFYNDSNLLGALYAHLTRLNAENGV